MRTSVFATLALAPLVCPALLFSAETVDLGVIHRIRQEAFQNSKVMEHAFYLTDVYGPRLTNSPGLKASAEWAVRRFQEWGLQNAALEPWGPFGRGWSNVRFAAHMKEPGYMPVIGTPRPWSPGTKGPVSGSPVLAIIKTEADFAKWKGKLAGKLVLLEAPRALQAQAAAPLKRYSDSELDQQELAPDPSPRRPFGMPMAVLPGESGTAAPYDRDAAARFRNALNKFLTEEGAAVAISTGYRGDGGTIFSSAAGSRDPKDPLPPPSVAIAAEHYNRIVRLLELKQPVTLEFDIDNRFHDETQDSYNVIAEIPGTDKKDEVVMIGAHLDSWTFATGATDNAAGCSMAMEAMRILKTLNLKMSRTVRIALWAGEEQGLLGSKAYVKQHFADPEDMKVKPEHAKLAGYFNYDNGTGKIRGIYLQGNDMARPVFEAWLAPFKDLGANAVTIRNTSGTDHLSFDAVGLPGFQFVQDPVEYSTRTHHSNMDGFDRLQAGDLMQSAAILASFAYNAATRPEMLPRKPLPKPQPRRPSAKPAESAVKFKTDIEFAKVNGESLTLDAHVPDGPGPFPAAIVVHGGGFMRGDKQTYVPPMFEPLAKGGFAFFTINYRLAPKHPFPAGVEDVERAIEWLRAHAAEYKVDPKRIALIGESAGGHLVSFAGTRQKVAAVVSFYGPHDFAARALEQNQVIESVQAFVGVKDLSKPSLAAMRKASPITYVKKGMPPYLLIHGTVDETVPFNQSEKMCAKMKAAGVACEVFSVPGGKHGVGAWEKDPAQQAYKAKMVEWLKKTL